MNKRLFLIVFFALVSLLVVLLLWNPDGRQHENLASGLAEAPRGGDFTLSSHQGEVSLSGLREKVVVLYFGYTWCPDICPTSLAFLASALNELSASELERLQVLFISVDPERDTLEKLKGYGEYFHPNILGVTGSKDEIERVVKLYGAAYGMTEQDSAAGYVVDHSADLYMIDEQGNLATKLPHGTPPIRILEVLQELLKH